MERVTLVLSKTARSVAQLRCRCVAVAAALLLVYSTAAGAQAGSVAGQVLHARTGQPIADVQIELVGTGTVVSTDIDGRFRVENLTGIQVNLRTSIIGYRAITQAVRIGDTTVRIMLTPAVFELDQIVVTGTAGAVERRTVGNAITTVSLADVREFAPVEDISRLINGRAPGVQVAPGTGMVGAGPRIRIRGASTLSLTDRPLIYVDGVRVNNEQNAGPKNQGYGSGMISRLGDFNPDDIESLEIIKGPAAATLYGTEASNGVIQIITKKGRMDTPSEWNITIRQGANWFDNPQGRHPINFGRDASGTIIGPINLVETEDARGTPIWRTGRTQEYLLSLRGGSSNIRYFLSGEFEDAEGIDEVNNTSKYGLRANVGFTPSDKWDFDASMGYVKAGIGLAPDISVSILFNSMYSREASRSGGVNTPLRGFWRGPPEVLRQRRVARQELDRFTGSVKIQHSPVSWFNHRLTLGVDETGELNTITTPFMDPIQASFVSATSAKGFKTVEQRATTYNTVDYGATATFDLSETITSATSVGGQYFRTLTEEIETRGREFTGPGLTTISGTSRITLSRQDVIENVTAGVYGQQLFGFNRRLFFTGAVRIDNNSAFGSDFSLVAYPKFSASWVVSEQPSWNVSFVNLLRLRAAFGQSGQQPETFAALRSFKPVTVSGGIGGLTPQFTGNPELAPERATELEVGFEAALLDERVSVDVTAFFQNVKDAILLRPLAPSGGFPGAQFINVGELQNRGLELQLNALVIQADAVSWDLGLNLFKNANKIVNVADVASGTTASGANFIRFGSALDTPGVHHRHQEGLPAGAWFGKKIISADLDATGTAINVLCDGGLPNSRPSGVGVDCDTAPEVYLGQPDPDLEGAIISRLTLFNRLTFYGLLDFKQGVTHGDNDTLVRCQLFLNCEENYFPERFDPVLIAQFQDPRIHNFSAADASFWKLRELSLSYILPPALMNSINAARGTVSVSLRNIHTWTDWPSLDPETFFLGNTGGDARGGSGSQFDKWSQTFTPHPMQFTSTVNLTY